MGVDTATGQYSGNNVKLCRLNHFQIQVQKALKRGGNTNFQSKLTHSTFH